MVFNFLILKGNTMTAVERAQALDTFIESAGWSNAQRQPLQADASFRRYIRLAHSHPNKRAMVMDAPPPQEDVQPFIKVARHLTGMGFSAPVIMQDDVDQGFLLLEDLGDDTFTNLLAQGEDEFHLYQAAIDTLASLHQHPNCNDIKVPAYDEKELQNEANLFIDWYFPQVNGVLSSTAQKKSYTKAWSQVFSALPKLADTLVLRDFHVDNLMLLDRGAPANCGLLDFQDALMGSPAYDVTSLLEDARRDINPEFRQKMLDRYFEQHANINQHDFLQWYRVLSAQRHMKIIGIFTRLYLRDKKTNYLHHLARVIQLLENHLQHEQLAPVANWLKSECPNYKNIPATLRPKR